MQKGYQDFKNKQREKNIELEERLDSIGNHDDDEKFEPAPKK